MNDRSTARYLWLAALGLFCLAALTGAAFRWLALLGAPAGISLGNLRHGHSHLMYMGWAAPAAATLISMLSAPPSEKYRARLYAPIVLMLASALAAYPVFLRLGYQPVILGSARIPLAALIGGINIVAWYWWFAAFWRISSSPKPDMADGLWRLAGLFLVLSSLGAWARGALPRLGFQAAHWQSLSLHWFLDIFATGWLLLALLGLVYRLESVKKGPVWASLLLVVALPFAFSLGLPVDQLGWLPVAWLPPVAAVLLAVGGLAHVLHLWPHISRRWALPLAFVILAMGLQLADALIGSVPLLAQPGARLFYLHVVLLSGFSLTAMVAAWGIWGRRSAILLRTLSISIGLMIASLLPLVEVWPLAWSGPAVLPIQAFASTLVPLVVLAGLVVQWVRAEAG